MAESESIRCMQMPLNNWQLLLPNSAVADHWLYHARERQSGQWLV